MKSLRTLFLVRLSVVAACLFFAVALTNAQSLPGYKAPEKPKIAEPPIATKVARGQAPLAKLYGHLKPDAARIKRLPVLDERAKSKKFEKRLEVGVVRPLSSELDPLTDGAFYSLPEGDIRAAGVVSEGALQTRVHFRRMSLPAGARVFVYSATNPDEYYGPYEGHGPTDDGTFWTPPVSGDTVIIEYFTPSGTVSVDVPFQISAVAHIYKDTLSEDAAGACNLEVTDPWTEVKKSVGMLQFVTGGQVALCTGTLLNDSDPATNDHLLTASHCINTQSEAQSLTVYWNYNTGDTPPAGTPTTNGANLLTTGNGSDFTLLRLTGALPSGLFFSGWDASSISTGTSVTGIHHPEGSHKRISFGATNVTCDPGLPGPCPNFTGVTWSQGTTEPGSSGSGIWTGTPDNAKLVGTLTGGYASCDNLSGSDFYGRFSVTYPHVASFLTGNSNSCPASPISVGQTINDALDASDCQHQHRGGSFADRYSFSGSTGQQIAVSMTAASNAFDTYLYLIGPSGTIVTWNDDIGSNDLNSRIPLGSGFFTLPANGTYIIEATSYDPDVTGSYTLTLSERPTRTLTITSLNPDSGVSITMNPADRNGQSNGTTQFTRTYYQDTTPILSAPGMAGGNIFQEWRKDGVLWSSSTTTLVTMDTEHTMTAVYRPLNDYVLTVGSSNPNSGVGITITPNDNSGLGNGVTQFTRTYKENTTIEITAPPVAPNGNLFQKWQLDGQDFATDGFHVTMVRNITMVAFYVPPATYTLTIASINPNSGLNITVSPNDKDGLGNGTTQFTRSYLQNTGVTLTAPATAPNGNIFSRWIRNGLNFSFLPTTGITMTSNETLTVEYVKKPVIYIEQGTTNTAAAVDSVTFVRGPFKLSNPNNFSSAQRTRIILFTSDLGLTQADLSNPSVLVVDVPGFNFQVENVGPLTSVPGLTGSYVVVRLPDGLPAGFHNLTVRLNGVTSDMRTLQIAQ